MKARTYTDTF